MCRVCHYHWILVVRVLTLTSLVVQSDHIRLISLVLWGVDLSEARIVQINKRTVVDTGVHSLAVLKNILFNNLSLIPVVVGL